MSAQQRPKTDESAGNEQGNNCGTEKRGSISSESGLLGDVSEEEGGFDASFVSNAATAVNMLKVAERLGRTPLTKIHVSVLEAVTL